METKGVKGTYIFIPQEVKEKKVKKEFKYDIGQEVWIIRAGSFYEKCNICNGRKIIILKSRSYDCPECEGTGKIYVENKKWYVVKQRVVIEGIRITRHGEIFYDVDYSQIIESDIFPNKKSAQAECYRRNNETKNS